MCSPIALAVVTVAKTGMEMYGAYQQGAVQSRYYNAVAEQKERAAEAAVKQGERQSELIQDKAKYEGKQFKGQKAEFNASQRAAMAASGMDLSSVTSNDVTFSTLNKQAMDEAVIRYNADVKSWETTEAAKYENWALKTEADQYRFAGKSAKAAARTSMFTSLLGGAASIAGGGLFGGLLKKSVTPGVGGYGANTPRGVINMGTWSKLPGR